MSSDAQAKRPTLYQRLVAAGVEIDHWQSDLQFPDTKVTRRIVDEAMADGVLLRKPEPFRNSVDGKPWLEANFQFDPFWEKCHAV